MWNTDRAARARRRNRTTAAQRSRTSQETSTGCMARLPVFYSDRARDACGGATQGSVPLPEEPRPAEREQGPPDDDREGDEDPHDVHESVASVARSPPDAERSCRRESEEKRAGGEPGVDRVAR